MCGTGEVFGKVMGIPTSDACSIMGHSHSGLEGKVHSSRGGTVQASKGGKSSHDDHDSGSEAYSDGREYSERPASMSSRYNPKEAMTNYVLSLVSTNYGEDSPQAVDYTSEAA